MTPETQKPSKGKRCGGKLKRLSESKSSEKSDESEDSESSERFEKAKASPAVKHALKTL